MKAKRITPVTEPLDKVVRLPGSKSLTNRALIVSALADGRSTLSGALFSDDTELMIAALGTLGIRVKADREKETIVVDGCRGQVPATDGDLFCGNSGTTIRFCTAFCALGSGSYKLDGIDRMRQRPIGDLVNALRTMGPVVGYEDKDGYPPVVVRGGGIRSSIVGFDTVSSSQYISALLMVAPYSQGDIFIQIRDLISVPYVSMTVKLMDSFGVTVVEKVEGTSARYIVPAPQRYTARDFSIEPDASNASYFLAAPAVAGGVVTVEGLGTGSVQGDVNFVDVLEKMGCRIDKKLNLLRVEGPPAGQKLSGVDVDLNDMPDIAQTLAVVALFAEGPTSIRNVGSLRVKETDRLEALRNELVKFGARVELCSDAITIYPPEAPTPARVETYDDHRMAMSFSLAALVVPDVEILDPTCVNKTFPDFFDRFEALCG